MTTKVVAPKLRFKSLGSKYPEWGTSTLGTVADFLDGRRKPIKESDRAKIKGKYPYYGASGIIDFVNDFIFDEDIILLGEDGENIVSRNLPLAFKVTGKCWVNNHAHVIKPKGNINLNFLVQYLDKISYLEYNTGTAQPKLNQEVCKKIPVPVPDLEEQTKIANFLTAVDAKISQLTKKHELLSSYKKGVMQKIFNQELRFKDDDRREFPEWELTTIGEISSKITAGGTPSTLKKEYWGGSIRWMNSGELNLKVVFEVENRITQAGLENSSTKLIPKNCVLIGLAGQGKTRGTVAMNLVELCTNQSIAAILPNPTIFNTHYLYQNLEARYDELRSLSAGDGGRGGLNLQIIKSMEISLPCLKEQTKIANFLTAIDDRITNVKSQLDAAKEYKQGLLQQMFV